MNTLNSDLIKDFNRHLDSGIQDNINGYFIVACQYKATLEDIEYMVNNGANPNVMEDQAFIDVCRRDNPRMVQHFIDKYNVNINAQNGRALISALANHCTDNVKILLNAGIKISQDAIKTICRHDGGHMLEMLLQYYPMHDEITKLIIQYKIDQDESFGKMLRTLHKSGTDFNSVIGQIFTPN